MFPARLSRSLPAKGPWKRACKRIAALLALPLVLFAGTVASAQWFLCGMDGVARTKCCCPTSLEEASAPTARVEAPPCCDVRDVVIAPAGVVPASASLALSPAKAPVLLALVPQVPLVERVARIGAPPADDVPRPGAGPPLPILHCALLL